MICRPCLRSLRLLRPSFSGPPPRPFVPPIPTIPRLQPVRSIPRAQSYSSSSSLTPKPSPDDAQSPTSSQTTRSDPEAPLPDDLSTPDMSPAEAAIAAILATELTPSRLLVQDVSGGCGSMYAIDIASPKFQGLSMLKQQRMVNKALGDLVRGWHGVQIRTSAS